MLDQLISNVILIDGTGDPSRQVHVGWKDGVVKYIGNELVPAYEVISGEGQWMIPGLIDIHTHYDLEVELSPALSESVRHGVTTVVMGNCSLSLTLGNPKDLADTFHRVESISPHLIRNWLSKAHERHSPEEYMQILENLNLGPHVSPLFGHSCLRVFVMGLKEALSRDATNDELVQMGQLLEDAFQSGFCGLSIDRIPWHLMSGPFSGHQLPSHRAPMSEVKYLANICRKYGRVLQMTPNPQHRPSILQIFLLALSFGKKPLRMSVIGALDVDTMPWSWRIWSPLLRILNQIGGAKLKLQTLAAPFGIFSDGPVTPLFDEFPSGAELNNCQTREERRALLSNPAFQKKFRDDWFGSKIKTCHRDFDQMIVIQSKYPEWTGQSFGYLARQKEKDPFQFFLEALTEQDQDLQWWIEFANRRAYPRQKLLSDRDVQPGLSDAGAHVRNFAYYDSGLRSIQDWILTEREAFPGRISVEELISRFTGKLADWWSLPGGTVEINQPANLCLLDPKKLMLLKSRMQEIADPNLNGFPRFVNRGLEDALSGVWISGQQVVEGGKLLEANKCGSALRVSAEQKMDPDFSIDHLQTLHPFTNYWPVFVLKHQHPANVFFHFLGVMLMTLIPIWFLLSMDWKVLLLWPISQMVGLVGHWIFERSPIVRQDAVFSVRATFCLYRLFFEVLTGSYFRNLKTYRQEWVDFLRSKEQRRKPESKKERSHDDVSFQDASL